MAKRNRTKKQTMIHKTLYRSSYMGWTPKGKQFLLYMWHRSCYSCYKPGKSTSGNLSGCRTILYMLYGLLDSRFLNCPTFQSCSTRFLYQMMFMSYNSKTTGVTCEAGTANTSGSPTVLVGFVLPRSLVFCVVFCRLFVLLSFFFWPLYCLSFD